MISILLFPFKSIFRFQLPLTFAAMGFINFFTIFLILNDLVYLLTNHNTPMNYLFLGSISCCLFGFYQAKKGPEIKKIVLPVANLPQELIDFKIVQISDLHIGPMIRKRYVEQVVKKINSIEAHIVALTGDIGDGPVKNYREEIDLLKEIKSNYGTFFVPGNHEYYWNANEWLGVMNNIGIINLVNRGKVIYHQNRPILVAGIPDPVSKLIPDLKGIQDYQSDEKPDYKILLSHRPGIAELASKYGFDLQLSGHTHAGQFFPWTIVIKWVHKISRGLHKIGPMWVYVNQGAGSWGPQLRLGSQTEVTLLVLKREENKITFS
jgi:predicted MPP superfamily phosphohydrolase